MEDVREVIHEVIPEGLKLVLLGKTGVGKSSTGNTIMGQKVFIAKKCAKSVTQEVAVKSGAVGHITVTVYDTPGLCDTDMSKDEIEEKIKNVLQECESGPCAFLLVIKADRFTKEERKTVEKIEKLLGEKRLKKTWILFTRGDELEEEDMTIQEFLSETEPLKKLVQKYDQRYHVFNNKKMENTAQVQTLIIKILQPYFTITGDTTSKLLEPNPLMRRIPEDFKSDAHRLSPSVTSLPSRRIVLLGKSGVGKSATGNTILGKKEFQSVRRMNSVTRNSSEAHSTVSGRNVSVIDTPGLFDTDMKPEELTTEIMRSVYISSPGPHAFLMVFRVNDRFTEQEQQIPQIIEAMFGQEVLKYSIILFTHGDDVEGTSVETMIKENCAVRHLVEQCGGRYHVFNNSDLNNRQQVTGLLQMIDTMIEQNGGTYYSNQMLEDAQRFKQEEEEQKPREEEQRKEQLEKEKRDETERMRKEIEKKMRAEFETKKKSQPEAETYDKPESEFMQFLSMYWKHVLILPLGIVASSGVGAVVGAGVGAVVGAGVVAGVVGAAAGVIAALTKAKAVTLKKKA